jgi:hypothetical protein
MPADAEDRRRPEYPPGFGPAAVPAGDDHDGIATWSAGLTGGQLEREGFQRDLAPRQPGSRAGGDKPESCDQTLP